jgi:preprotein translocase subunit YajC
MNRLSVFSLALAGSLLAASASAQEKSRPRDDTPQVKNLDGGAGLRGKIVRVQGENQFIVRTADNKEVTLYASPQTRYTINGKAGKFGDLRVGTEINANYSQVGERYNVNTVTVGALADTPPAARDTDPPVKGIAEGTAIRGRIVKLQAPDQFVVRSAAGKEVVFFTSPQTRYTVDGRVVQFRDLRVGSEVNAEYALRDGRHIVSAVTVGPAAVVEPSAKSTPARDDTRVEGTVIRIGEGVVVVKTNQNKEITINVDPKTRYVMGEEPARISDFRTGSDVRIEYDVRDRRPVARIINGLRRNNK